MAEYAGGGDIPVLGRCEVGRSMGLLSTASEKQLSANRLTLLLREICSNGLDHVFSSAEIQWAP
jgi:hypothetical protein